jgi:hydrogenase maturation protein HypF
VARRIGLSNVALSGGCFQNQYLASALDSALRAAGFEVFAPRRFPPNDGGLAFGQVFVARHLLREASHVPGHSG